MGYSITKEDYPLLFSYTEGKEYTFIYNYTNYWRDAQDAREREYTRLVLDSGGKFLVSHGGKRKKYPVGSKNYILPFGEQVQFPEEENVRSSQFVFAFWPKQSEKGEKGFLLSFLLFETGKVDISYKALKDKDFTHSFSGELRDKKEILDKTFEVLPLSDLVILSELFDWVARNWKARGER